MNVFVTGISGYIGQSFLKVFSERSKRRYTLKGIDVKELPPEFKDLVEFKKMDVRSSEVESFMRGSDVVVHMAFVLNPPKDREEARKINIDGTRNVLNAAKNVGAKQVIVLTSASTYGAHPDNPLFMKEDHPLRGDLNFGFWYSEDKAVQDRIAQVFAKENPNIKVCIVRPAIVFGEGVNNFISQGFFNPPLVGIFYKNIPFQYIYETDVARALWSMIDQGASGIYNLAGEGVVTMKRGAEIMGKPVMYIPHPLHRLMYEVMIRAKILDPLIPFAAIDFFKYPWTLDTTKSYEELGFKPEVSSEEAFIRAWNAFKSRRKGGRG